MDALQKVLKKHSIKIILPLLSLGLIYWIWVSPPKYLGYAPDQPIPFSHRIHAGELQIDCQFCHTAVERSAHATVPDTATCIKCHQDDAGDSVTGTGSLVVTVDDDTPTGADGQPIVLLNDRQTIGGYPKIGSALSLDTARLAQLRPGGIVHFAPVSPHGAHNALHLAHSQALRQPMLEHHL